MLRRREVRKYVVRKHSSFVEEEKSRADGCRRVDQSAEDRNGGATTERSTGGGEAGTGLTHAEESIDMEEAVQAMRKLKSGRPDAPICEIEAEVLESRGMVAAEVLHRAIELARNTAEDWKKSVPVPRTYHGIRKAARRCAVATRR